MEATFKPRYGVKTFGESLCVIENILLHHPNQDTHVMTAITTVMDLLRQVEEHRPTGPDGKHDQRHTETCGCEDK